MIHIAPSILAANFINLGNDIKMAEKAGAAFLHIDIMDGHFVPNISFGPGVLKQIRSHTKLPLDVHLMINPVDCHIDSFVNAGADIITVHVEACPHLHNTLQYIKNKGVKCGVAFNPATDLSVLPQILDLIDLVLIMTVNPGFGGQKFITSQLAKIKQARALIDASKKDILLEVDGGINDQTAGLALGAGAKMLVAGSYIFNHKKSVKAAIDSLKNKETPS